MKSITPRCSPTAAKYLAAAAELAHDRKLSAEDLAKKHGLDAAFLKRWIEVLAVDPFRRRCDPRSRQEGAGRRPGSAGREDCRRTTRGRRSTAGGGRAATCRSWSRTLRTQTENIPGKVPPHQVAVHPTPKEFVAVAWKSPVAGRRPRRRQGRPRSSGLRQRRGVVARTPPGRPGVRPRRRRARSWRGGEGAGHDRSKVEKGDRLVLAVDARNGDHSCDLTEIALTITETAKRAVSGIWLPTWPTPCSPATPTPTSTGTRKSGASSAGRRDRPGRRSAPSSRRARSLADGVRRPRIPARQAEAKKLAEQVQTLLTGTRPGKEKDPDRVLYDNLVSVESALFNRARPVSTRQSATPGPSATAWRKSGSANTRRASPWRKPAWSSPRTR